MTRKPMSDKVRRGAIVLVLLLTVAAALGAMAAGTAATAEAGSGPARLPATAAAATRRPTPRPTLQSARATPTRTPGGRLLLGPTLLKPDAKAYLDLPAAVLEWSRAKKTLDKNEFYVVTLRFRTKNGVWQDYAYTQNTTWRVIEHAYLTDLAIDNTFTWRVQLYRITSKDKKGGPLGTVLSVPSLSRVFHIGKPPTPTSDNSDDSDDGPEPPPTQDTGNWAPATPTRDSGGGAPTPPPTPDCGAYCPWLAERPSHNQLAGVLAMLGFGLTLGMVVFVRKPAARLDHD